MLGTKMTWEEIFAQTDRDINLQRVMNAMVFGEDTGVHDWIPDRAIGPIDDDLYNNEREYHDQELSGLLKKPLEDIQKMGTAEKRKILMEKRTSQLSELIHVYYQERGWNTSGIPTVDTLKKVGLWTFLNKETRAKIARMGAS
jgi:aldehyde:ferredoxin oxidoreductase